MYYLWLFASLITLSLATSGDFKDLNFCAAAPYTYNHTVGGGAYNCREIGNYASVVESLEGKEETCGDIVTYFLAIEMQSSTKDDTNSIEIHLSFLGDSTGQSGVALGDIVRVLLNSGLVENGANKSCSTPPGAGHWGYDSEWTDYNGDGKVLKETHYLTYPLFTKQSTLECIIQITGLQAGEKFVLRVDVRLLCQPGSTPTGNLQGALISATCMNDNSAIPGGQQTVPFKTVADIQGLTACVLTGTLINGTDFTANVQVSGSALTYGGVFSSTMAYSWTQGAMVITATTSGVKSLSTYDTQCSYGHHGEYLYSQGTCGCESIWIPADQPQMFYASNGGYYNSNPIVAVVNGVTCLHYTSLGTGQTISDLYLSQIGGIPVQAVWTDGSVWNFYNVAFGPVVASTFQTPATTCACKRRLDIAIAVEKSAETSVDMFTNTKTFMNNVVSELTISPQNTQMTYFDFADTCNMDLSLANGISSSNCLSSIASMSCTKGAANKMCGVGGSNVAAAIDAARMQLATSTRLSAATQIIVIVFSGSTSSSADITAAVLRAQKAGITLFGVAYSTILTNSQQLLVVGNDTTKLIGRVGYVDLGAVDPQDLTSKMCMINTRPCGSLCCGVCDTVCGTCLPVDTCVNSNPGCSSTLIVPTGGACCISVNITDPCPGTVPSGSCNVSACDHGSNRCVSSNACTAPPAGDNCYTYTCSAGKCSRSLNAPPNSDCYTYSCQGGAIQPQAVSCGSNTSCYTFACVQGKGCVATQKPDPSPNSDPCVIRSCTDPNGYTSTPVVCSSTDPCNPSVCSGGVCVTNPKVCKVVSNLCDLSYCNVTGGCTSQSVVCPSKPCFNLATDLYPSTNGCNPATGTCVYKPRVCQPTGCENEVCNETLDACVTVPTPGCSCTTPCTNNLCQHTLCDPSTGACGTTTTVNCSSLAPDTCTIGSGVCSTQGNKGCIFTPINCTSKVPSSACVLVVADPTYHGCCKEVNKTCNLGNPCKTYGCDATGCTETDKCVSPDNDKCITHYCNGTGCATKTVQCTDAPNACYTGTCNSTTGVCDYEENCDDGNPCTTDTCTAKGCSNVEILCDDQNACTIDSCDNKTGSCQTQLMSCDDGISCTKDTCDTINGCMHEPVDDGCQDVDPCKIGTCNVTQGCVYANRTCPPSGVACLNTTCVPYQGCVNESFVCNASMVTVFYGGTEATSCMVVQCDQNLDQCTATILSCDSASITAAVVGSVLGAAAICGIVIAVACVGFGGAAAAAYAQRSDDSMVMKVNNNPMYKETGSQGVNPLHKATD